MVNNKIKLISMYSVGNCPGAVFLRQKKVLTKLAGGRGNMEYAGLSQGNPCKQS